jgi:PIN domain nuclease of toxin-antitoxin system
MSLLLDTHDWIWFAEDNPKLLRARKVLIEKTPVGAIYVSAVSVWEIAMLVHYGRLVLAQNLHTWVENSLQAGIQVIPLTAQIALESYMLPGEFHKDPADRMIVATARQMRMTLMTQDKAILAYGKKGHVRIAR